MGLSKLFQFENGCVITAYFKQGSTETLTLSVCRKYVEALAHMIRNKKNMLIKWIQKLWLSATIFDYHVKLT